MAPSVITLPGGFEISWNVAFENAAPVGQHVLLRHRQVHSHGEHGDILVEQVVDRESLAQLRPPPQHREDTADGEVEHQVGFQIQVVGVELEVVDDHQTAEVLQ